MKLLVWNFRGLEKQNKHGNVPSEPSESTVPYAIAAVTPGFSDALDVGSIKAVKPFVDRFENRGR